MDNLTHKHRTVDEIILQWAAITNQMGILVTMGELKQFGDLISDELITFILLKQFEGKQTNGS